MRIRMEDKIQSEHEKVNRLIYEWNTRKANYLKQAEQCDEELYKLFLQSKRLIMMKPKPIKNERI